LGEPRGPPYQDHEESRGKRVERAGMAHAAYAEDAAEGRNDVVRRRAGRLVDE
jgi:hypothetical protein